MSDEIDIEEHDVLDNPTIRKIFPDLSIIKKEILQYEGGLDVFIEQPTTETDADSEAQVDLSVQHGDSETRIAEDLNNRKNKQQIFKDSQEEVHLRFKTFLDSLDDDVFENIDDSQSDTFNDIPSSSIKNTEQVSDQNLESLKRKSCNNVFILGSKPNLIHNQTKITEKKQLRVALKNVWPYLMGSKQYCKHCFILFPNTNTMKWHMNKVHTLRSNKMFKKKNIQNKIKFTEIKFQCDICSVTLCSKGNLVRHLKTVHKESKAITKTNLINKLRSSKPNTKLLKTKRVLRNDTKTKMVENNNCFHCQKEFESQSSLIEHLYDVLNPDKSQATKNSNKSREAKNSVTLLDKVADNIDDKEHGKTQDFFVTRTTIEENKTEINDFTSSKQTDLDLQKAYSACKELAESVTENIQTVSKINYLAKNNQMCNTKQRYVNTKKSSALESSNHNLFYHQSSDISEPVVSNSTINMEKVENSAKVISIQNKQVYQCYICSQYKRHWKWYSNHMDGHNIKNVHDADTVTFDAQCKFCDVKLPYEIKLYNRHISNFHSDKLYKKINADKKAFHSVLFKCIKCEVCFLTANSSKKHSEHVAIFVNWKCPECHRLLKIKDRAVHLKQHLLSNDITVYALYGSALDRILYKCLKCAVHFSEKQYFIHFATCDLEMPNSAYCNICDILVNRNDIDFHELNHKDKKLRACDFTFIESEVINNVKLQKKKEKQNMHTKSKFALTFCSTCNCFLSGLGRKREAHIERRCGIINPRMCRKCGLIFTSRGYISHKTLHDKVKNLNLQAFYIYDIKTKMQIRPPMPKYPSCNICEVHFLGKKAIKEHLCTKQNSIACNLCKIQLTEAAYKLHLNFHNYKLSSTALSKKQRTSFNAENAITSTTSSTVNISRSIVSSKTAISQKMLRSALKKLESSSSEVEEAVTSTTSNNATNNLSPPNLIHCLPENANTNDPLFLFTCILCQITFDVYDKVIEHCHDHYDYKESLLRHKNKHFNDNFDPNVATQIHFDPFYIRFDKDIWNKHIFKNLTAEQVVYILEHTKYKFEYRLKMEEIQPCSPSIVNCFTIYKCDICRSYVEPNELYAHVSTKCTGTRKHPCSVCGLCFFSQSYKNIHEKTHENQNINKSSYKIILFNKRVHQQFTQMMLASRNKFILYQCRNCEVITDKLQCEVHECSSVELFQCSHCGLLFYDNDLKLHVIKHEQIKQFQPEQMIVIMFGKLGCKRDTKVKTSFNGIIYDLTFYKCTNCGLCFKTKTSICNHVCVSKSYESQCPKCYLCFLKEDLEEHFKLHENNLELDYDNFNSNIISFTKNTEVQDIVQNSSNQKQNIDKGSNLKDVLNDNLTQKIYKCRCGLHFLEELIAKKHLRNCNPRMKISKQSCFKCDLLFTPGELFNHLLKHHSNKKKVYKYDIINVSNGSDNENIDVL